MKTDFLIIGAGIVGLSIARALQQRHPGRRIDIIEKETDVARHASGRNSGVLHAGFYYTEDSLKAKFTREGNLRLKEFCREYGLPINPCGKVVVAQNEDEIGTLHELERRGKANGVNVSIIDESSVREIDPNIRTCRYALHSPETATVDPRAVVRKLRDIIVAEGGRLHLDTSYLYQLGRGHVRTTRGSFDAGTVINCAGLYADKIAGSFGFGEKYTIIPFKGIYLKYSGDIPPVRTNVYPVPNLRNPFLGVHYTVTVDGAVKIGPTAIPAFWRENYKGWERFDPNDLAEILWYETRLFLENRFHFRELAYEEFRKYSRRHLAELAGGMVMKADPERFDTWSIPGIRAQLLDTSTLELLQDFVVEGDERSVHILNAVSPAFTCAFPFAEWVVDSMIS